MLVDGTIKAFLEELSSDSPAPGGGSVAALSGALGAGLISMVCRLSKGRGENGTKADLEAITARTTEITHRLTQLIDEDTKAFNQVMQAFRLPKTTDDEKAVRNESIQKAFKQAALVPAEVMGLCGELLKKALLLVDVFNPNTASDLGVATQMAYAGMKGASMNVRINLKSIKEEDFASRNRETALRLMEQADKDAGALEEKIKRHLDSP